MSTPTDDDPAATPPAALTKHSIVVGLTAQRQRLNEQIAAAISARVKANDSIREARAELADVDRMLAAAKPRKKRSDAQ